MSLKNEYRNDKKNNENKKWKTAFIVEPAISIFSFRRNETQNDKNSKTICTITKCNSDLV